MTTTGYPKVSLKRLPQGGIDVWCRGCQVQTYAAEESMFPRIEARHAGCPEMPAQERRR